MRELLTKKASRANSNQVVAMVGENPELYKELVELIIENESPVAEKAAWAMNHCFENGTGNFDAYYPEMTRILPDENYSDSIKRNIVRVLQFKQIPEKYQATVIDSCFGLVINKKTAVAVKAFSLGVLENMVKLYPELKNELKVCVEELMPTASSGLKNRVGHILRRLG